jgi:hypothetical protein
MGQLVDCTVFLVQVGGGKETRLEFTGLHSSFGIKQEPATELCIFSCEIGYVMVRDDSGSSSQKILDSCQVLESLMQISKNCLLLSKEIASA